MGNGDYKIDEETFKGMPIEHQNWILYKTFNERRVVCDRRFVKLERRKAIDTSVSAGSGVIGGFIAVLLKRFLGG